MTASFTVSHSRAEGGWRVTIHYEAVTQPIPMAPSFDTEAEARSYGEAVVSGRKPPQPIDSRPIPAHLLKSRRR